MLILSYFRDEFHFLMCQHVHCPQSCSFRLSGIFVGTMLTKAKRILKNALVTCFTFTRCIKVVVGAQQLALPIHPTVIDAWRQVGAQVHLGCHVGTLLKPEKHVTRHTSDMGNKTTIMISMSDE